MENRWVEFGFQVLQFILTAGTGFYVFMSGKNKVTNERISKLESHIETKIDEHSERISRLESDVSKSPTHADIVKLHEKLSDLSSALNGLKGEFKGASTTLHLIHETLMERK
jgi:oligoendopeptidase F